VLQRFRGELTMLDGGRGGGEGFAAESQDDEAPPRASAARSPARASAAQDLDDEIPF